MLVRSYRLFIVWVFCGLWLSACGDFSEEKAPHSFLSPVSSPSPVAAGSLQLGDTLDLTNRTLSDAEFLALFSSTEQAQSMTRLNLTGARFNHQLLDFLPTTLEEINLTNTELVPVDLQRLVRLYHLRSLDLSLNQIGDGGVQIIAENIQSLTSLNLSRAGVTDAGARSVAELPRLHFLSLSANPIGNDGAIGIAVHQRRHPTLVSLDLSDTGIGTAGISTLLTMEQLRTLNLSRNTIRGEDLTYIAHMQWLTTVYLESTGMSHVSLAQIRRDMPNTQIVCPLVQEIMNPVLSAGSSVPVFRLYEGSEAEALAQASVIRLRDRQPMTAIEVNGERRSITAADIPRQFVTRYRVLDARVAQQMGVEHNVLLAESVVRNSPDLTMVQNWGFGHIERIETNEIDPAYHERELSAAERDYIYYLLAQVQSELIPNYRRPGSLGSLFINPDTAVDLHIGVYEYDSMHFTALMVAIAQNNEVALMNEILSLAVNFDRARTEAKVGFLRAFIHLFITKEFPSRALFQRYAHFILDSGNIR